jgi:hypothetical protein
MSISFFLPLCKNTSQSRTLTFLLSSPPFQLSRYNSIGLSITSAHHASRRPNHPGHYKWTRPRSRGHCSQEAETYNSHHNSQDLLYLIYRINRIAPPSYSDINGKSEYNEEKKTLESPDRGGEKAWALDEAAYELEEPTSNELESPSQQTHMKHDVDCQPKIQSLAAAVIAKIPQIPSRIPALKQPVIIPSRRPGPSSRAFVRAYAPVLAESGIPQDAFMSFLKNFHRAPHKFNQSSALSSSLLVSLVWSLALQPWIQALSCRPRSAQPSGFKSYHARTVSWTR